MNENENQETTTINLYEQIIEKENTDNATVDIKQTLLTLIDDYLEYKTDLTDTQKGELARFRSRIIIELQNF